MTHKLCKNDPQNNKNERNKWQTNSKKHWWTNHLVWARWREGRRQLDFKTAIYLVLAPNTYPSHPMPRGAVGLRSLKKGLDIQLPWKISLAHKWGSGEQSMKIYENLWKSMKIYENRWISMKIYENPWKSMKSHENQWKSIKINENRYKCMKIHENLWKSIKSHSSGSQIPEKSKIGPNKK